MRKAAVAACAASAVLAVLFLAAPAQAYLGFIVPVRGVQTTLKWQRFPVRWFARDAAANGVPAASLRSAAERAFSTWQSVPTSAISFSFVGFSGASPFADDGISIIGFQNEPEEDRVLGSTGFTFDVLTGEIVEADIFVNSAFLWSTAESGDTGRYDLESVLVHEIGHFLGLGHSALGETELQGLESRRVLASGSVMFPISFGRGNVADRLLQPDDIAGVSAIYPDGDFASRTGSARGRVLRGGLGIFGAHVVAFNLQTGALVGSFTLKTTGEFQIDGLTPGPHILRVEPLDDASVESFFEASDPVDAAFAVTYADRIVVVPPGGASESVDIVVRAR